MGIKVKNIEIETLLLNKPAVLKNRDLPVKTLYWLGKLERKLLDVYKDLQDERQGFIKDHCRKDEHGELIVIKETGQYEFPEDGGVSRREFNRKIGELMTIECELPFDKLTIPLDDVEKWNEDAAKRGKEGVISADEMMVLIPFVEFV